MERLTEKLDKMIWFKDQGLKIEPCEMNAHHCRMILEKLVDYEEAEEQGLLVRLPCKVGDTVWDNDFGYPESYEIKAFSYGYCDSYVEPGIGIEDEIIFYYESSIGSITGAFPMSEIGKTVFLTREEAVNKLEEMKNEI